MSNFEIKLYKAMSICEGNLSLCKDFWKIYTFTTENISEYLEYFELKNKSLLTVGSSGDQVLNAYYSGAKDITLFDINEYAKYYTYLKVAAILSLDYMEFQEFFFKRGLDEYYNPKMFNKEIFNKIKSTLRMFDYESYLFFDELINLYEPFKIRDYLFDDDETRNTIIKESNTYLKDENSYNKLKNILKGISFKYINGDIFKDNIPNKYDNIFLSNLCTTTSIDNLKKLLEKLNNYNLNSQGSILLGYLWEMDFNQNLFSKNWKEIYKMPITREKLKEYITEHHQIRGAHDIIWQTDEKNDLVLIYRKK